MLNRPRQTPQTTPNTDLTDFYYYMGICEGGPLMTALESLFQKAPLSFKLCFLAIMNIKVLEQEIEQAAASHQPINKRDYFKNAAIAFTSAATTALLTTALEDSLGWWAAPTLMIGGKLLIDKVQGKNLGLRETFSPQNAQRYYNNVASWWNRQQPATAPVLEAKNNSRQLRV